MNTNENESAEDRGPTERSYYPRVYYQIAAAGCVAIAAFWTAFSVYQYPINGEWGAGTAALVIAILWAVIGILTNNLREAHHG